MGAGIAMCFANAGVPVTLVETSEEAASAALARIAGTYKASSAFRSGRMTEDTVEGLLKLISPGASLDALSDSDMVIEAVFENMGVKKEIFTSLESICKPEAILATNTSYLSIDAIGAVTSRPDKVVGMRKFGCLTPCNAHMLYGGGLV
jgi:3-hydroxyacyl-CoA dehydrogenase